MYILKLFLSVCYCSMCTTSDLSDIFDTSSFHENDRTQWY